ncbi:MAG: hypothetical protein JSS81_09245 [Acidobacteria bacterium]|nr:hypothetical protein [Acidobacteriota bacterium]
MKFLIILALFAILFLFIWRRYRRQIETAVYVFRMFRKMRQMIRAETNEKQIETKTNAGDVELVRCLKCGSWTPRSNALKLGGNSYYCSSNCLEQAVVRPE